MNMTKPAQLSTSPVAMLSAVSLTGLPTGGPPLQFRCHLSSHAPGGTLKLQQITQPRTQPDWLIKYLHDGPGFLSVAVQFRSAQDEEWHAAGEVSTAPAKILNGNSGAVAELPLNTCRFAPDLHVRLQFSKVEARPANTLQARLQAVLTRSAKPRDAAVPHQTKAEVRAHLDEDVQILAAVGDVPRLAGAEEVIVKDTWNKLLPVHEMLMEMFFERLLHEEPDLINVFDDAIDNMRDNFTGLFDLAVRGLRPQTENILRESYRGVPGLPTMECRTVKEFVTLFADLGMRSHHWLTARKVWLWMLNDVPYLEDYDRENLRHGSASAHYKFFTVHIIHPAVEAVRHYDAALTFDTIEEMTRCGAALAVDAKMVGIEFYQMLFTRSPEVIPYFGRTDVDHLADHLFKAIAFLTETLQAGDSALGALRHLAAVHTEFMVPPEAYDAIGGPLLDVMRRHYAAFDKRLEKGWSVLLKRVVHILSQPMINRRRLLTQARDWLDLITAEQAWPADDKERRWSEIEREVTATGTYTHTYEELAYGAQVAWRNAPKCIARISWRNMIVRDLRHVTDPDEMFKESLEHVRMGINGGNMQIVMNVFRPKRPKERWGPRFWNPQYLRYAGYLQPDGTVIGDGANVKLTQAIERLGWQPPKTRGRFDILPLVIEVPGQGPKLYEIPNEAALQVAIEHPTVRAFASLDLKWFVIPAIANFRMDIGGIHYGCMPFNGWFMETEIARNLWELGRYNQAEKIAALLGLDTSSEINLWRDRAFLELNVAVLHSFAKAKVSMVDHQTASRQFLAHDLREKKAGRECPAQWSWVVPAVGGSSTPVWHHEMRDFYLSPHYHYAADKWAVLGEEITELTDAAESEELRAGILILYGSETGTAESFARQTARRLQMHRPKILALDDCDPLLLAGESMVLVITSTFGEGDLPGNAKRFGQKLKELSRGALTGLHYTVLALGSTIYPHFCAAGAAIDQEFGRLGATRIIALHRGDEIKGQAGTFHSWLELVARLLGEDPTAAAAAAPAARARFLPAPSADGEAAPLRQPGFNARVISNRELLKEIIPGSRSTRSITFDRAGSGITYETGDHLSVAPRNPAAEVARLCVRLGVDPVAWFVSELVGANGAAVEGETDFARPSEVRRALAEDVDLSLREPLFELLTAMEKSTASVEEKSCLAGWVEGLSPSNRPEDVSALSQSIIDQHLSVIDLLDAFPACRIDFGQLLDLLPKQKPRLYSISSSNLTHPDRVQVTIGVVQVQTATGKIRQGVCSNFLAGLDPERGDIARIMVRTSTFRPPAKLGTPMLMVGPGTGLSPLIGFLQHRGALMRQMEENEQPKALGDARLYFGCRNLNDYIYQQELEEWRNSGLLTHLIVAFSRLTEKKTYVQHLIAEHGPEIWQVLSKPDCHYYICGDAKMADDVFDSLMGIVQHQGGLTRGAAIDFFDRMKAEKRFHADVWGITLNFNNALVDVREAKYAQGERWLRQVNAADQVVGPESVAVTSAGSEVWSLDRR